MMYPKLFVLAATLLTSGAAIAQQNHIPLRELPGYVTFDTEQIFGEKTSSVEIYLEAPLLKVMSGAIRDTEPDLAELLDTLALIRVNVYPVDSEKRETLREGVENVTANLEQQHWSRAVRVREEGTAFELYLRTAEGNAIAGLAAFVTEASEAVFINIVGDIKPEELGALMSKFMGDKVDTAFLQQLQAQSDEQVSGPDTEPADSTSNE